MKMHITACRVQTLEKHKKCSKTILNISRPHYLKRASNRVISSWFNREIVAARDSCVNSLDWESHLPARRGRNAGNDP